MGNLQQLDDDAAMIGWGTVGAASEVGHDGTVRWDAHLDPGIASYRAYRSAWVGRPSEPPDAVVATDALGARSVYVSWNGATEVVRWRLSTGATAAELTRLRTVRRQGFETAISLRGAKSRGIAVVEALDGNGSVLGVTRPLKL